MAKQSSAFGGTGFLPVLTMRTGFPLKPTHDMVVARVNPGFRVTSVLPVQSGLPYFSCVFCAVVPVQC